MLIYEKLKDLTLVFNVILTLNTHLALKHKKTEHSVRFIICLGIKH